MSWHDVVFLKSEDIWMQGQKIYRGGGVTWRSRECWWDFVTVGGVYRSFLSGGHQPNITPDPFTAIFPPKAVLLWQLLRTSRFYPQGAVVLQCVLNYQLSEFSNIRIKNETIKPTANLGAKLKMRGQGLLLSLGRFLFTVWSCRTPRMRLIIEH